MILYHSSQVSAGFFYPRMWRDAQHNPWHPAANCSTCLYELVLLCLFTWCAMFTLLVDSFWQQRDRGKGTDAPNMLKVPMQSSNNNNNKPQRLEEFSQV
eukprot:694271-Amphidinium_carterae.1